MIYRYVTDKVSSDSQSLRVNISNKKFLLKIVLIVLGCIVLLFLELQIFSTENLLKWNLYCFFSSLLRLE